MVGARDANVRPLSRAAVKREIGPQVDAARRSIRGWVAEQNTHDFAETVRMIVPVVELMLQERWLTFSDESWEQRIRESIGERAGTRCRARRDSLVRAEFGRATAASARAGGGSARARKDYQLK